MVFKALKDIAHITMGQSPESESYNDERVGIPFFQGNADFGEIYPNNRIWCSSPKKIAEPGDILISVRAPIGALNYAKERCCIGRGLAAISIKDEAERNYVFHLLKAKNKELNRKGTGSTFKAIGKNVLEEVQVPQISTKEQQKRMSIMDYLESIIRKRREQLLFLDELIKARFVEMFGDVNANDRKWPIKPLGELCNIVRGASPRPIEKFLGGTVPWIKIGDATENESVYLNSTKEHIIENGVKKSRLVKSGSLIFANCGVSLGFARIITFDGCIHDGWLAMEDVDQKLDKVFLLHTLNQVTEHFRKVAPAGTQPNLNTAIMKSYKQILPPLELQRTFIELLFTRPKEGCKSSFGLVLFHQL